jgi:hypothetical protein
MTGGGTGIGGTATAETGGPTMLVLTIGCVTVVCSTTAGRTADTGGGP